MSYGNPYDQSGLSEGFAKGFELALNRHHTLEEERLARRQQQLAESRESRESQIAQMQMGLMGTQQKIAQGELDYQPKKQQSELDTAESNRKSKEAETQKTQAELEMERQEHPLKEKALQARITAENAAAAASGIETKQKTDDLINQRRVQALATGRSRIGPYLQALGQDPTLVDDVEKVDALINHKINSGADQVSALRAANAIFAGDVKQQIGDKVSEHDSNLYKVPKGAPIVGANINEIHMSPDQQHVVLGTTIQYRDEDGSIKTYDTVHSDNDNNVVHIPVEHVKSIIKGAAAIPQLAKQLYPNGDIDYGHLGNTIDSELAGHEAAYPKSVIASRGDFYSTTTGDVTQGYTPSSSGSQSLADKMTLQKNAALARINSNYALSPQMKQQQIDAINQQYAAAQTTQQSQAGLTGNPSSIPLSGQGQAQDQIPQSGISNQATQQPQKPAWDN